MSDAVFGETSPERFRFALDHTHEFFTIINRSFVYEYASASYCAALELPERDVIGRTVEAIWGRERFDASVRPHLERCFRGETVSYLEKFKFGSEHRYMHVRYFPYPPASASHTHVVVASRDITNLGELEQMLINHEYHDPVTGLFNRKSLEVLLEIELFKAQRGARTELRSLLLLGVENLAEIRRRHGYEIGDRILENTGIRIREAVRDSDYVFSFEGDELAVILTNLGSELDVAKVARKIVQVVSTPYRIHDTDIPISFHVGSALYPLDGATCEDLLRNAAFALGEAVKNDREYERFDSTIHRQASRHLTLMSKLRRAFELEQFELYFQPIMRAAGGVEGAEALIRWNLPSRGIVRPGEFLPIARESGMMDAISRWAIFAAVRQIARLRDRADVYLTVNLTASDFESDELPNTIEAALEHAGGNVAPAHIKLEITESDAMRRADVAIERMAALQQLGFEVFVDDFGTGHSSLSNLRRLPANTVKIDKSFVDALTGEAGDVDFVRYIVELLKLRRKRVIAEGVTTFDQIDTLTEMGCDSFQGFYFAEPLPRGAFERFLDRQS